MSEYGTYAQAEKYLGEDFVPPERLGRHFNKSFAENFQYSPEQLDHLADTVPHVSMLIWAQENQHILVPGPISDLCLLDVRKLESDLFIGPADHSGWWEEETFPQSDRVNKGEWLLARKTDVPNSRSKKWDEQSELIAASEYVPNVAEVAYGMLVYYKVKGIRLFPDHYVNTSSVDTRGFQVKIGGFGQLGISVPFLFTAGRRASNIGICSARTLR